MFLDVGDPAEEGRRDAPPYVSTLSFSPDSLIASDCVRRKCLLLLLLRLLLPCRHGYKVSRDCSETQHRPPPPPNATLFGKQSYWLFTSWRLIDAVSRLVMSVSVYIVNGCSSHH